MSNETEKQPAKLSVEAKEARFYAKIYSMITILSVIAGLVVSGIFYNIVSGGHYKAVLESPGTLFYLMAPFLPSLFFTILANRKTKKFPKLAKRDGVDIKALRKRTDLYSHKKTDKKKK